MTQAHRVVRTARMVGYLRYPGTVRSRFRWYLGWLHGRAPGPDVSP